MLRKLFFQYFALKTHIFVQFNTWILNLAFVSIDRFTIVMICPRYSGSVALVPVLLLGGKGNE